MNILLIAGGWSEERDVSLRGAVKIQEALTRLGHIVELFDPSNRLHDLLKKATTVDFAFINLHGSPGEDGVIQAMLDSVGCPYQGAGPAGSLRALNKAVSKELFRFHSIPTPDWIFLSNRPGKDWKCTLPFPVFVKPNDGGSSVGITMCEDQKSLNKSIDSIFAAGRQPLIERFVPGIELTCGILGNDPLPLVLIKPNKSSFFDYSSKYEKEGAEEICPAPVDEEITVKVQTYSLKAHQALGLKDYSRADFIMHDGSLSLLEVNTLPGMTPTSLLPQEAAAIGLSFGQLIEKLIALGLESS